jgi:hypothetical protein
MSSVSPAALRRTRSSGTLSRASAAHSVRSVWPTATTVNPGWRQRANPASPMPTASSARSSAWGGMKATQNGLPDRS